MWSAVRNIARRRLSWFLDPYGRLRRRWLHRRFQGRSAVEVFSDIYRHELWGPHASVSGPSSTLPATVSLRQALPGLFHRLGIRTMLDAPCGDFHWMSQAVLDLDSYIGADIVPELVGALRQRYGDARRRFVQLDLTQDALPLADALFCRDCLIHLSNAHCRAVLDNFRRSRIRWLITTTGPHIDSNRDIVTGEFRMPNLCRPPFDLPAPRELLDDTVPGRPRRVLGVWERTQVC